MANDNARIASVVETTATAGEALNGYTAVVISTAGVATYPEASGDSFDGVVAVLGSVVSGETVRIIQQGIVPGLSASGIAVGDSLVAGTTGNFLEAVSGQRAQARALAASGTETAAPFNIQIYVDALGFGKDIT